MQTFFMEYLNSLQEMHTGIREAVGGVPQSALDWTFASEMNSLNVLAVHLMGAERYWIGDVVDGEPSGRDRDAEFRVQGLSEHELIQKLSDHEAYLRKTLEKFAVQELEEKRISPRDGREFTVGWALCHALKHTALHVGHIQITRQLWEKQQSG
jgi:uncharacterized damage-inducible protein DinB